MFRCRGRCLTLENVPGAFMVLMLGSIPAVYEPAAYLVFLSL